MIKNHQKGVSLIVTFFILTIISAVVLSIIAILYSQIKVIRNMGNSIASYYAAESGIEKVSYYDRKVTGGRNRGICLMCDSPSSCSDCICLPRVAGDTEGRGCDSDKCTNCMIKFRVNLSPSADIYYDITANIFPTIPPTFTVTAIGSYKEIKRAIQITPIQ